jgi:GMP synthase-like glutamine amidotransferase
MSQAIVHIFQHVPFEGPGYIADWLNENGYAINITRFYQTGFILPEINAIDALIILGGPMSVYDDLEYPWLHLEKAFIEDCIDAGKKVFGICLGAQLMALCMGARVYTASHKEIGWFPVLPTSECKDSSWLYELFMEQPVVFHWHGDKFDIPYDGSLNLLSSYANGNQAFSKGDTTIALQFHLEITMASLLEMLDNGAHELKPSVHIQSGEQIRSGSRYIFSCNNIMAKILAHWLTSGTSC